MAMAMSIYRTLCVLFEVILNFFSQMQDPGDLVWVDDHTLSVGRSPNDITYWVAQLRLGYKYSITIFTLMEKVGTWEPSSHPDLSSCHHTVC